MIKIVDKHNCCGCEACVQICPKHCIAFTPDNEGFYYPKVDETVCVNCGICEKVCPILQQYEERSPLKALSAINKNNKLRMASSSGGIFVLIAEQVIDKGGVVFGARFDVNWQVILDYAETKESLRLFLGSKYVQARVGSCFSLCKQFLEDGRMVLFAGTQCQVAGLLHYLNKPYENLLVVDFICHGVPSPKVWKLYLDEVITKERGRINYVDFRDKSLGWKLFSFVLNYGTANESFTISSPFMQNEYMQAFLANLILRPSCYACPAKGGKSHSDITIADFWGIESVNPDMDDDLGTSLVLINTDKGASYLPLGNMKFHEEIFGDAIGKNLSWKKTAIPHLRRAEFFEHLTDNKSITLQITHALRPTLHQRLSIIKHPRKFLMKLIRCFTNV